VFEPGTLITRVFAAGPILYIGLLLIWDPVSFVNMAENFANELRSFENRLRGRHYSERLYCSESMYVSSRVRMTLQGVGAALSVLALIALVGL
jgi:hypothetical protein